MSEVSGVHTATTGEAGVYLVQCDSLGVPYLRDLGAWQGIPSKLTIVVLTQKSGGDLELKTVQFIQNSAT